MEYRLLGRTGVRVSALGFGCGDVGGLMVRGAPADRERGVARALELGINYLDTAPAYGSGESEKNLGQVLRALKPQAIVGTKWRLAAADLADVAGAVARSVETSLGRLGLERVDLLHLHNLIGRVGEERPRGVSGPGLRPAADAGAGAARRHHRHPGARGWSAERPAGAPPDRDPHRGPDRLGARLRDRRGARPRAGAAGGPGPRGQRGRGRAALRNHRPRALHRPDRLLRPGPARLRGRRGQQGPAAPRRPRLPPRDLGDLLDGVRSYIPTFLAPSDSLRAWKMSECKT